MNNVYIGKLLSIVTFLTISICAMIIALTPTATGYEISIYNAYPFYFWGLIIFAQLMGITILLRSYLNEEERSNWKYGFLGLFITDSILLSLALIRNYFILGRGDVLSSIGYMNDILLTGRFYDNLYPVLHIFSVETYFTSGIQIHSVTLIIPIIFSLFFIISFYLLFNRLFEDKKDVILAMIPASILLYGVYHSTLAPNQETFFLIPFFLYCYFSSRQSEKFEFALITIVLAILITLSHPLVTLIIILLLILIEISNIIYSKVKGNHTQMRSSYNIIIIMSIIFVMWQSVLYLLIRKISKLLGSFTGEETANSQLEMYSSLVSQAKPHFIDLIHSFFDLYGQLIIVGTVASITIIYLLKNREKLNYLNIFFSISFLAFIVWSAATLTVVYIFGFGRTYVVAILLAVFLIFVFLKTLLSTKNTILNKKYVKSLILLSIFVPLIFFSNLSLYNSPVINTPNSQVTLSEYYGMQTYFGIRNDKIPSFEYGVQETRFFDLIYYYTPNVDTISKVNISAKRLSSKNARPIDHFGYNNYTSMADYYHKPSYLIINDWAKLFYPSIYPEYEDQWRFTSGDFEKLNQDRGLSFIYDNSNIQIYLLGG